MLEIIWVTFEGVFVPQIEHLLTLESIVAGQLDLLAIQSEASVPTLTITHPIKRCFQPFKRSA